MTETVSLTKVTIILEDEYQTTTLTTAMAKDINISNEPTQVAGFEDLRKLLRPTQSFEHKVVFEFTPVRVDYRRQLYEMTFVKKLRTCSWCGETIEWSEEGTAIFGKTRVWYHSNTSQEECVIEIHKATPKKED